VRHSTRPLHTPAVVSAHTAARCAAATTAFPLAHPILSASPSRLSPDGTLLLSARTWQRLSAVAGSCPHLPHSIDHIPFQCRLNPAPRPDDPPPASLRSDLPATELGQFPQLARWHQTTPAARAGGRCGCWWWAAVATSVGCCRFTPSSPRVDSAWYSASGWNMTNRFQAVLSVSTCAPEAGPVPGGRPARRGAPGRHTTPPYPSPPFPPPLIIISHHPHLPPSSCLDTPPLSAPRAPTKPCCTFPQSCSVPLPCPMHSAPAAHSTHTRSAPPPHSACASH